MNAILPLYQPLPTPDEIRRWDEITTNTFGIPPLVLMENASREALRVLERYVPITAQTRILVFIGKGNNGGDGVALARHLHDLGCRVLVYHTAPLDEIKGVAKEHLAIAQRTGVNFLQSSKTSQVFLPQEWHAPDVIVDAVLGNGFKGELKGPELTLVRTINQGASASFILSLDIPTGLSGLTGRPQPEAVRADATVVFEAAPPGLFFSEAEEYIGHVHVRPIGIPQTVRDMLPASWRLLQPVPGPAFTPSPRLHKGQAGRVIVIGGSAGMTGAPVLAAHAALRTGAGLVRIACPAGLEPQIRLAWPEIMTIPLDLSAKPEHWTDKGTEDLLKAVDELRPDCLVLGPGLGRMAGARNLVQALLSHKGRCPAVVDADALFFFRLGQKAAKGRGKDAAFLDLGLLQPQDIVTPHPGEMARLLPDSFFSGLDGNAAPGKALSFHQRIDEAQNNRPRALDAFTAECQSVCVFKGAGTLIGQRETPTTIFPLETATLATAGSGDALSGAVAALVAQGLTSLDAACFAAYLHGYAGLKLQEKAPRGHRASEIADMIPLVWQDLQRPNIQGQGL